MNIDKFKTEEAFDYENGYYLTSDVSRIGKIMAHYELYKKITELPGSVVELGVFKGSSLIRFATYRELLENQRSRKIIGFDMFGEFPETEYMADKKRREAFIKETGGNSLTVEELETCFKYKEFKNIELIKGNILETVPYYVEQNAELKISLLHIDTDIYEPAKVALEYLYDKVVKGGVIIFDDYGTFPGETKAVDEFFEDKDVVIKKFPFSHNIPAYIIKK